MFFVSGSLSDGYVDARFIGLSFLWVRWEGVYGVSGINDDRLIGTSYLEGGSVNIFMGLGLRRM